MPNLIEIAQAGIIKVGEDEKAWLFPQIKIREMLGGPGGTAPAAPTLEGMTAIALAKAKKFDMDRGITFIQDFDERPYQSNGPWKFSAAARKRHGITKKD